MSRAAHASNLRHAAPTDRDCREGADWVADPRRYAHFTSSHIIRSWRRASIIAPESMAVPCCCRGPPASFKNDQLGRGGFTVGRRALEHLSEAVEQARMAVG